MDTSFQYHVYGLRVGSNRPIPNLTKSLHGSVDVCIDLSDRSQSLPRISESDWHIYPLPVAYRTSDLQIWYARWGSTILIRRRFAHHLHPVEMILDGLGRHVWVQNTANAPIEDIYALLTGPGLGSVLRRRSKTCLHASVAVLDDQAIFILGEKGDGKSTTAAALTTMGLKVLSDDIAVLRPQLTHTWVESGYPHLRLQTDALVALGQEPAHLSTVLVDGEKRYLPLSTMENGIRFQFDPCPLAAIYVLEPLNHQHKTPYISPLSRSAAMLTLTKHSYARPLIAKSDQQRDFQLLGRLANTIPVRSLHRPDNLEYLPQICELLVSDARALITT